MYFKCTCGVGSSIKLKYDWLMCSGLTFRENTKCFLNTLQNHFDDPCSRLRRVLNHTSLPISGLKGPSSGEGLNSQCSNEHCWVSAFHW